jgi:hypothetical protein
VIFGPRFFDPGRFQADARQRRDNVISPIRRSLATALLLSGAAFAQTSLILKTRRVITDPAQVVIETQGSNPSGSGHLLLQFNRPPSEGHIRRLTARGVTVLADVPEDGLLVSVAGPVMLGGLGVRYAAPIHASDKISPILVSNGNGYILVEYYPDVDMNGARTALVNAGADLSDNPDLGSHMLMIRTSDAVLIQTIASQDAVSYLFPASDELAQGLPVRPCSGALTTNGATTQSIPTYGYGWDGPGLGAATVFYYYSNVTSQLNATAAKAEIARAMAQWANVVKVTWAPGTSATASRTVNILWATYAHGDSYPFDGPGGALAHTFYPANPNPEPIAGDMHLNDSDSWHIGTNIDLFSVTLHELGHALGLGHSDNPNDVMYPYYKMTSGLAAGDIAAIRTMYAAQGTTSTSPLTLTVNATDRSTIAASLNLSGSATGGSGAISVTWSANGASGAGSISGTAWTISNIPLVIGTNTVTITARQGTNHISQVVTVTRTVSSTSGGSKDTTPPSLVIASPGATSVSTTSSSILFSGTATDNAGVTSVTWATSTGPSGTANGTANWSASIPLLLGYNVVTIRAYDAAGNFGWRSVVVTRY